MRAALRSANAGSIEAIEKFWNSVCVALRRPTSLFVVVYQTEPSGAIAVSVGAMQPSRVGHDSSSYSVYGPVAPPAGAVPSRQPESPLSSANQGLPLRAVVMPDGSGS